MSRDAKILYNAECPVCNFEISHYADYARAQALPLVFEDLNTADLAPWNLTRDQAAKRLYVLKDGVLYDGIPAFLVLWADMPRYRWLGKIVSLPGLKQLTTLAYDRALAPLIYNWHKRRKTNAIAETGG